MTGMSRDLLPAYYISSILGTSLQPEIVALGTGNTCLSSENICEDGRALIDSYAVAVARRAFLKYEHYLCFVRFH